jgi:hypothetical protein
MGFIPQFIRESLVFIPGSIFHNKIGAAIFINIGMTRQVNYIVSLLFQAALQTLQETGIFYITVTF